MVLFAYIISVAVSDDEKFLTTGEDPLLTIESAGHALSVFVNGQFAGNINTGQTHPHGSLSLSLLIKKKNFSLFQELLTDHWRTQS